MHENHEIQKHENVDVALLDQHGLQQKFPWLNVDDLALGSLGLSGEGWFDGYALLMAFRASRWVSVICRRMRKVLNMRR
ncbi:hypothetical protein [Undibacterium sp. KW1]|uniref:hypothetical protein n=1 Tax=Undibacterium sp. KW1 TaxID=2058624 RepID=UPI001E47F9F3|nr:hypothetical protein [Undibacterium sp. KW1]